MNLNVFMVTTSDFKNGLNIEWENEPYTIIWFQHHKPGKGGAVMRVKLQNIHSGSIIERTFKSGERFRALDLNKRKIQYLYAETSVFHFMDMTSYEQIELQKNMIGDHERFLKENMEVSLIELENKIIGIELPMTVEMHVIYTEPGVKGDTVNRVMKPARTETGADVGVPIFIKVGDVIKVDTRTGEYIERV